MPIWERAARRSGTNCKIWGRLVEVVKDGGGFATPPPSSTNLHNLLLELPQPLLYRAVASEFRRHRVQDRFGGVGHADQRERVGAKQADAEPDETAVGAGREARQRRQRRLAVLLVDEERLDREQPR